MAFVFCDLARNVADADHPGIRIDVRPNDLGARFAERNGGSAEGIRGNDDFIARLHAAERCSKAQRMRCVANGERVIRASKGLEVCLKLLLHRALRLPRHVPHDADDFGNFFFRVGTLTCRNGYAVPRDRAAAGSVARNGFVGHGVSPPFYSYQNA